jgi:hypothetical protein
MTAFGRHASSQQNQPCRQGHCSHGRKYSGTVLQACPSDKSPRSHDTCRGVRLSTWLPNKIPRTAKLRPVPEIPGALQTTANCHVFRSFTCVVSPCTSLRTHALVLLHRRHFRIFNHSFVSHRLPESIQFLFSFVRRWYPFMFNCAIAADDSIVVLVLEKSI